MRVVFHSLSSRRDNSPDGQFFSPRSLLTVREQAKHQRLKLHFIYQDRCSAPAKAMVLSCPLLQNSNVNGARAWTGQPNAVRLGCSLSGRHAMLPFIAEHNTTRS